MAKEGKKPIGKIVLGVIVVLNLMIGLNGFTLCSGIICEELNGSDYRAVPFRNDGQFDDSQEENQMEIGYITRKNLILSKLGQEYVTALRQYLAE